MRFLSAICSFALASGCSLVDGPQCTEQNGFTTGSVTLRGVVLTPEGAPAPGMKVELTRSASFDLFNPTNDFKRTGTTDEQGAYAFNLANSDVRNGLGSNLRLYVRLAELPGTAIAFYAHERSVKAWPSPGTRSPIARDCGDRALWSR
jgi:hypothetical protein